MSNTDKQGLRHAPFCFTEQGVAMLSSVLKSKQARSQDSQSKNIDLIFQYIDRLQEKVETPTLPERKRIGYEIGGEK